MYFPFSKEKIFAFLGRQVAQSIERRSLDVEVWGSKPALGNGGGVRYHLTSPIRRNARSLDNEGLGN